MLVLEILISQLRLKSTRAISSPQCVYSQVILLYNTHYNKLCTNHFLNKMRTTTTLVGMRIMLIGKDGMTQYICVRERDKYYSTQNYTI